MSGARIGTREVWEESALREFSSLYPECVYIHIGIYAFQRDANGERELQLEEGIFNEQKSSRKNNSEFFNSIALTQSIIFLVSL